MESLFGVCGHSVPNSCVRYVDSSEEVGRRLKSRIYSSAVSFSGQAHFGVDSPEESVSLLLQAAVGGLLAGDWAPPGSDGDRAERFKIEHLCLTEEPIDCSALERRPPLLPFEREGPKKKTTNSKGIRFIMQ